MYVPTGVETVFSIQPRQWSFDKGFGVTEPGKEQSIGWRRDSDPALYRRK